MSPNNIEKKAHEECNSLSDKERSKQVLECTKKGLKAVQNEGYGSKAIKKKLNKIYCEAKKCTKEIKKNYKNFKKDAKKCPKN